MERISLIGLTWQAAGPDLLARCTLPEDQRAEALPRLAEALGSEELVYLATCNRVEVAFVSAGPDHLRQGRRILWEVLQGRPPERGEAERRLHAWAGEGAVEHLFLVAAGLDSARVGETEIAGQLRRALDRSDDLGLLGPRLAMAGREALRVARRIHATTRVGEGSTSLAGIALERVRDHLVQAPGRVALVGVSPMTRRCAATLAAEGTPFLVVNRTVAKAEALCAEVGAGEARALETFAAQPDPVAALVLAVGAAGPVLGRATLERLAGRSPSGAAPLLVDLGIPANVAPQDADAAGLPRVGMDAINAEAARSRDRRLRESAEARVLVDEALEAFRRAAGERVIEPILAALHRRYRHTADEGVERLLRRLQHLQAADVQALREWAATLAARFAHIPSRGLRSLVAEWGAPAVGTFFRDADDVLMRELGDLVPGGPE